MTETLTLLACAVLLALFIFQLLLIAGLPLGKFAWGGQHIILPKNLRIASISSLILYGIFAAFILTKGSVLQIVNNDAVVSIGMWVFTGYFFLGVLMNAFSRSKSERLLMVPTAFVLAILFLLVTIS